MDWSKLPDLIAVVLLAWAFASVARHSQAPVSNHWLTGWLLIVVHFAASLFASRPGIVGFWGGFASTLSLVWAGVLFIRAAIPYRAERSSHCMFITLLTTYTLYVGALFGNGSPWLLNFAAMLLGIAPLVVAITLLSNANHRLRWLTVGLQCALSLFLLSFQNRPNNGGDLALNAILFTVYFSSSIHFWHMYRRVSAGAFITISGFFTWALVFVVAPLMDTYFPAVKIESEVWNLPKYVVAVGMILLLLEDQIAHNKHLALHDALTGLPNRRLFQDRLTSALERARRTGSQTALLILDLDRFKEVNDTMGHHAGDLLLQKVAGVLSGRMRRSDTVARTGGDEFAVILEAPTSRMEAERVGKTLLDRLNEPMALKNVFVQVGASLGMAVFPEDADDIESLCITADLRMYDDKRADGQERKSPIRRIGKHSEQAPPSHPETGVGIL